MSRRARRAARPSKRPQMNASAAAGVRRPGMTAFKAGDLARREDAVSARDRRPIRRRTRRTTRSASCEERLNETSDALQLVPPGDADRPRLRAGDRRVRRPARAAAASPTRPMDFLNGRQAAMPKSAAVTAAHGRGEVDPGRLGRGAAPRAGGAEEEPRLPPGDGHDRARSLPRAPPRPRALRAEGDPRRLRPGEPAARQEQRRGAPAPRAHLQGAGQSPAADRRASRRRSRSAPISSRRACSSPRTCSRPATRPEAAPLLEARAALRRRQRARAPESRRRVPPARQDRRGEARARVGAEEGPAARAGSLQPRAALPVLGQRSRDDARRRRPTRAIAELEQYKKMRPRSGRARTTTPTSSSRAPRRRRRCLEAAAAARSAPPPAAAPAAAPKPRHSRRRPTKRLRWPCTATPPATPKK